MKLTYKTIETFLRAPGKEHRACLVYGPDSGLVRERCKLIREAFLGKNADSFALAELDMPRILEDPALLADELRMVHMLADKRVIFVRGATDKLTKIIEDAAEFLHDGIFLLVAGDDLSSRSSLRAWFEKAGNAASLPCYHDEARDIQQVIQKYFATESIIAEDGVLPYLLQQLGNDRSVTQQELTKIALFAGDTKRISLQEVRALIDYNRDVELDDVVHAVADRNLQQMDHLLQVQIRENPSPVPYLRALQRYFNRLYALRIQCDGGRNAEDLIKSLRPPVFYKNVPIMVKHVQNWKLDQIVKALRILIEAELASKSSDIPAFAASSRKLMQITQVR
jgi:DNA polymerase-3 subunit delta